MPAVSAYHYLTLGSTTLSHIDIRKGIITQSDNQEDELLAMCFPSDYISDNKNDTVLVAHGEGIVTIWKDSKNRFMDQLSRIKVNKSASIDCIMPTMNADDEEMTNSVWCGDSEGLLHRVNYKKGKVVETRVHSSARGKYGAVDEVGILDIDYDYRLISAGMDSLKIWSNREVAEDIANYDEDSDLEDSSDDEVGVGGSGSDSDEDSMGPSDFSSDSEIEGGSTSDIDEEEKQEEEAGEEDDESEDNEDVFEEEKETEEPLRRKRPGLSQVISKPKRRTIDINKLTKKEKTQGDEKVEEEDKENEKKALAKLKEKKLTTKQLRNMQKHEHGIRKFEGL
ncbi:JIP5 [[Candida] subhashii]|uniref:JIP5 n=1 Tax=[Candida] subhashii TaxID=561895 RepID=A0A8J5QHE9_9ASCO|nr:JIP5 [[Candida] subhashii]KAG7663102.1 JIP5 [[Candida] subhashii]